jgi:4-amino-4-deoxy-L-arabinose transferase-like glycosyltransferase
MRNRYWSFAIFIAVIAFAAFLRLYRLDSLPPGLHYDEAFNATMAQRVQTGVERPLFFTEDLTEEPMAIYVTSLSFALFGASPWSLRLVSACAGILTVAALYMLAREMFRSTWVAALASFILAILYWHINFSRLGMEPIFTPLMLTLSFAFLWRGMSLRGTIFVTKQSPNRGLEMVSSPNSSLFLAIAILSGVFLGATMYTYKAALFVPILAALFFGIEFLIDRKWLGTFAFVGMVAIFIFAPLGLYFAANPNQFLERPTSVTASSTPATILDNTIRVAGMFFMQGDENPRSNLPFRPVLDPFLAIGFILGIISSVVRIRQRESRFMLLWLGVMVLPSILTDYAPHFGRSIGVTPVVALITAYGFASILRNTQYAIRVSKFIMPIAYCILFTGLFFSTFSTFNDYFTIWASRTGLFDSFDVGILNIAKKLSAQPTNESLYVSPIDQHYYTLQFGLNGRNVRSFDAQHVLVLPASNSSATYGIITRQDSRTLNRLAKFFPSGRALETIYDWKALPYAVIFHAEGTPQLSPQKNVNARLGNAIELIGYDFRREGNTISLTMYWRALAEMREDYTVFTHLIGAINPATQSPVWAQDDARPGHGSFPTTHWRVGEIVIDEYRLIVPDNAPAGNYQIEMGMYNLETGGRLRVVNTRGVEMENDRVLSELPSP